MVTGRIELRIKHALGVHHCHPDHRFILVYVTFVKANFLLHVLIFLLMYIFVLFICGLLIGIATLATFCQPGLSCPIFLLLHWAIPENIHTQPRTASMF